jgi:hypothetical protein
MYNNLEYQKTFLTGATTAQIFSGKGTLHSIVVGLTSTSSAFLFDMVNPGTLATTNTAIALKPSVSEGVYNFDAAFANGCYLTCGTGGNYTVLWTK